MSQLHQCDRCKAISPESINNLTPLVRDGWGRAKFGELCPSCIGDLREWIKAGVPQVKEGKSAEL